MKPNFILNAVVTSLLLATTVSAWAIPPRQHAASGVIVELDRSQRRLVLTPHPPLDLVWHDRTPFVGHCPGCHLNVGQAVKLYSRREAGQNVLREVSFKAETCQSGQP